MTDLTDDQVRALAHRYRFAKDDHERTIAQTALALLTARAEKAEAESRVWDHAAGMTTIEKRLADAGIEVKPLEWREFNDGNRRKGECFSARSLVNFAPISVHKKHDGWWLNVDCETHPTLEAAKAAAQADYEARILSALQERKP